MLARCMYPYTLLIVCLHLCLCAARRLVSECQQYSTIPECTYILQDVTRIRYVTDGVLLREMMDDPLLTRYR